MELFHRPAVISSGSSTLLFTGSGAHTYAATVASVAFTEARGLGRRLVPAANMLGRMAEDWCLRVEQLVREPIEPGSLGRLFSHAVDYALALGAVFGPANFQEGRAVIAELYVGLGQRHYL